MVEPLHLRAHAKFVDLLNKQLSLDPRCESRHQALATTLESPPDQRPEHSVCLIFGLELLPSYVSI